MAKIKLFVYGTLKRGQCRASVLAEQTFLREAKTMPNYKLLHLGAYPGLVEVKEGGIAITGELHEVDHTLIPRLDAIEGSPFLFNMEKIEIANEKGDGVESSDVYCYFYKRNTPAKAIESGVW